MYDWITVPTLRCPCRHSVSRISSVASVYGEFSMSMRTKNPFASAGSRMRRMLSTAVARSTSSPSCVSLSEMLRSMPEATIAPMICDVVGGGRRRGRGARHAFAEIVERQVQALARQIRDRGNRFVDRLAGDEPAREAAPGAIPYFEASRCSVETCASPWNSALEVASQASVGSERSGGDESRWTRVRSARSSEARCARARGSVPARPR